MPDLPAELAPPSSPLGGGGIAALGGDDGGGSSATAPSSPPSSIRPPDHSTTSPLSPLHSAIFAALLTREPAPDIAKRLSVPPEIVFAAMRSESLRGLIEEFEADDARGKIARSTSALDSLVQKTDDPIERRRAATS